MSTINLTSPSGQPIQVPTCLFIENNFVPSASGNTIEVQKCYSGANLGRISEASKAHVDTAVRAADKCFQTLWRNGRAEARGRLLLKLADLVERDADVFTTIEAVDAGVVFGESKGLDVAQAVETLRYFAGLVHQPKGHTLDIPGGYAYTKKEPFGVGAAILPWNAPLMIMMWKLAPGLAPGNTLVIKTPELAPLCGQYLGVLIQEAGFPAGPVSILGGLGSVTGQALAEHP